MHRLIVAGAVALGLAGLLAWQWSRERQVAACQTSGGVWNGPKSRCEPKPGPIILRRDLERS